MDRQQSFPTAAVLQRRTFLRGLAAAGSVAAVPALAGCGGGDGGGGGDASSDVVTFGLNANAAIPTAGYDAVFAAFQQETGLEVRPNKLLYTEQVNNYLQSAPDDVLIWNAGYRMRFFADQGLVSDLSDVYETVGDNVSDAVREACTADDGAPYLVPFYQYPWVVYYRKSLFAERGFTPPTTIDELSALATQMQSAGLVPFAFADKEGWEAMGTFDILNMRVNGFDFHIELLNGEQDWTGPEVRETFELFSTLVPFHQEGALGRTWQEAAAALQQNQAGMYLMGSFVLDQFSDAEREDLDFFVFPEVEAEHGTGAIDAPIDGFMMVADPDNPEGSRTLLEYLGTGAAQDEYLATDQNTVGTALDVDTSTYSPLQTRFAEVLANATDVAQYLDRDTRPDFSAPVFLPALQDFLRDPGSIDSVLESVQSQAESIFV